MPKVARSETARLGSRRFSQFPVFQIGGESEVPNPKKPTSLKVLEGNPGKRPLSQTEPQPEKVAPGMPPGMDYYAKQKWEELQPKLERLGVLTEIDGDLFEAYCRAYGRYRRANQRLEQLAKSDIEADWRKVEISVEKAESSLRLLANEFGLGPASRAKISVGGDGEPEDPMAQVLRRR